MFRRFGTVPVFTDEGNSPETSEHLLRFSHFHFINHFFFLLLFIVCQQKQHCEDLPYFALHAEEEEQFSTARVGVVRSGVPGRPRLDISEDLYFVMELDFAGLLILLPPPRAKRNKISPSYKSCNERKNSSNS